MKRIIILLMGIVISVTSLFGMLPEAGALAEAAAKTVKVAERRVPTAAELTQAEQLQAAHVQFVKSLERHTKTPLNGLRGYRYEAKEMADDMRQRLKDPQLAHYAPAVIEAMVEKFTIPTAEAVALLNFPPATMAFLEDVPHTPRLRESTKTWISSTITAQLKNGLLEPGEKTLLEQLLQGVETAEFKIPPLMNKKEFSELAIYLPLLTTVDKYQTNLLKLLLGAGLDVNHAYYTVPQDKYSTLFQYVLNHASNPPADFMYDSTGNFIRLLADAGATLSDANSRDTDALIAFIENTHVKNEQPRDSREYLSSLKELLQENAKGKNIHFLIAPFITELKRKSYSTNPILEQQKIKLLETYASKQPSTSTSWWSWGKK